ncbi:MAG: response regulator, partial [Cyanobacteria bacterium]|nr:response regulator [Cyanobacteriota bacterium]
MGISSPRATILAVDDQPDNLRLLAKMLNDRGYKVRKALNGRLALTTVQVSLPDLILLDITMPDISGYEVCARLKASETSRNIPVIFVSGLGEALDKVKAFEVGAADYITKPFHVEEVLARVENQLTICRQQQQIQAQNQQLQAALHHAQHLNELKSRFVAMVSHEFRGPLTTI